MAETDDAFESAAGPHRSALAARWSVHTLHACQYAHALCTALTDLMCYFTSYSSLKTGSVRDQIRIP